MGQKKQTYSPNGGETWLFTIVLSKNHLNKSKLVGCFQKRNLPGNSAIVPFFGMIENVTSSKVAGDLQLEDQKVTA